MRQRPSCTFLDQVEAYFEGRIARAEARGLHEHLAECGPCRRYYQAHLVAEDMDPLAPGPKDRMARALGLKRPAAAPAWVRALRWLVPAAAAVVVVVVAAVWMWRPTAGDPVGFQPRAGRASDGSELLAYRVDGDGHSVPAAGELRVAEVLGFAYINPAGHPFLAVFAVDDRRRVMWFHPAWLPGKEPPKATTILRGSTATELDSAVKHTWPHPGTSLTVHGVFLSEALDAAEIERRIGAAKDTARGVASLPGTAVPPLRLRIVP